TAGTDPLIKLWNSKGGQLIATLTERKQLPEDIVFAHYGKITSLAFSEDGERLVSGSVDGSAKIWSTSTYQPLATLKADKGAVNAVAVPTKVDKLAKWNVTYVATAGDDGVIRLWSPDSSVPPAGTSRASDQQIPRTKNAPIITPEIPSSWESLSASGWIPQPYRTLEGHTGPVYALAFSSATLASAGRDRLIKLWSPYSTKEITTLRGHTLPV